MPNFSARRAISSFPRATVEFASLYSCPMYGCYLHLGCISYRGERRIPTVVLRRWRLLRTWPLGIVGSILGPNTVSRFVFLALSFPFLRFGEPPSLQAIQIARRLQNSGVISTCWDIEVLA